MYAVDVYAITGEGCVVQNSKALEHKHVMYHYTHSLFKVVVTKKLASYIANCYDIRYRVV